MALATLVYYQLLQHALGCDASAQAICFSSSRGYGYDAIFPCEILYSMWFKSLPGLLLGMLIQKEFHSL